MAVQSLKNPYRGINAHLNSLLQTPGTASGPALWHSFHAHHIGDLTNFLNDVLPDNYVAMSEQALQVRSLSFEFGDEGQRRTPDISIYSSPIPTSSPRGSIAVSEEVDTLEVALLETLDLSDELSMSAVVIRSVEGNVRLGRVVTRLELLSPSNKLGDDGYEAYRKGRHEALYSGIPLIELDYLHETPLPFHHPRAYAYVVAVSDPRPSLSEGRAKIYGFGVDTAIPTVQLPLAGSDHLKFDFGAVYQHTFERGKWGRLVDYTNLPARVGTYSPADQERIRAVMERISISAP